MPGVTKVSEAEGRDAVTQGRRRPPQALRQLEDVSDRLLGEPTGDGMSQLVETSQPVFHQQKRLILGPVGPADKYRSPAIAVREVP